MDEIFYFFLLFYNDLDLNNQKILCLPSIFQFERKVGFWTTLVNSNSFFSNFMKKNLVYKVRHLYYNVLHKTHILNKFCPIYPMYIHIAQLKVQCILDYMLLYKRADLWMQEITNEFLRPAFAVALYRAVYWHTELTY